MCVFVYAFQLVKNQNCVQPVKLQGITALIILASTVESELQPSVKKTVEIPDDKLGKYMMERKMISLFSSARLTG